MSSIAFRLATPIGVLPCYAPLNAVELLFLCVQDEKLQSLVEAYGASDFHFIASFFDDRSDMQLCQRWQMVLNPELVKGPWTKEVGFLGCLFNSPYLTHYLLPNFAASSALLAENAICLYI